MIQKQSFNAIKGMRQDISPSKANPEYIFDARNIRLTARGNDTLLSITNEQGTKECKPRGGDILIQGKVLGYCVISNYLVVFSTKIVNNQTSVEQITRIYQQIYWQSDVLYTSHEVQETDNNVTVTETSGNLNFGSTIQTLGVYENENIQKVYWVDGVNQPRVINITKDKLLGETVSSVREKYNNTSFDFVPELQLEEEVTVTQKVDNSGVFQAGVIQYAFTYYNKYGQESNIFYVTDLYNITHSNRGASQEDMVGVSFEIVIDNVDQNFDFIRIYSIHRTSIDATPYVKIVNDVYIKDIDNPYKEIIFTDNNTTGESIDPTLLLYIGGEDIVASTIAQKDNTLFLGNISITRQSIPQSIKDDLLGYTDFEEQYRTLTAPLSYGQYYQQYNFMQQGNTCTFMQGEHYRLGVQFQYKNGKWSEPVVVNYRFAIASSPYLTDAHENDQIKLSLPMIHADIPNTITDELYKLGYRKARGLVVNPSISDRLVIAKGMICPTVYKTDSVTELNTYQSSWFLRPIVRDGSTMTDDQYYVRTGALAEYRPEYSIKSMPTIPESGLVNPNRSIEIEGLLSNENFMVSQHIVTFHSPDIEFDSSIQNIDGQDFDFTVDNTILFSASIGDIDIQTSSPPIGTDSIGFKKFSLGTSFNSIYGPNGGARSLISGMFYYDYVVDYNGTIFRDYNKQKHQIGYLIYPWQSSGSLNNDINRPSDKGTRSAVLKRKVISNIKFSFDNKRPKQSVDYKIKVNIFNSNEQQLIKLGQNSYLGNVDTLLIKEDFSKVVSVGNKEITEGTSADTPSFIDNTKITDLKHIGWQTSDIKDYYTDLVSKDISIRMKYKSTPHAVFQLMSSDYSTNKVLPFIQNSSYKFNTMNSNAISYSQPYIQDDTYDMQSFLYMGKIHRKYDSNYAYFGGRSEQAVRNNLWIPSGPAESFGRSGVAVYFLHGDCYYSRYDCLKTYPYTNEDENSVVEIASFMVESRINLEGRYDRNQGLISNINMTPQNFNLQNPIYAQKDNFFNYRILDKDAYKLNNFPNTITWSKEKSLGEDIDTWTNVNMVNTIDMDGNSGQIQDIENYNNELYCFQNKGVSKILFNNRVQIPTSDNIPIEISNGYKVQGKVYLSNTVGCQNQKAIITTPNGIYFSDLYNSGIYLLNNQGIQDISTPRGFTNWVKECQPDRLYYDTNNGDLYLIGSGYSPIIGLNNRLNYKNCLCFSEKLNEFTSFMDYDNIQFMFNIAGSFYSLSPSINEDGTINSDNISRLYKMFSGDYNSFFGNTKPYHISYIANQNPTNDKIFNTLEFRADTLQSDDKLVKSSTTSKSPNICPFNKVTVWNEYQEGTAELSKVWGKPSNLKEKFRTWRVNIPRDNGNKRDRIRNPWAYIKLEGSGTNRMQLHDMQVWYYDNSIYGNNQR